MIKQPKIVLFLLFSSVFQWNFLSAQKLSEVLKDANSSINSFENLSFELSFLSYTDEGIISKIEMKCEKVGEVNYTHMENVDSYQMDSTQIVIDHDEKSILLNTGLKHLSMNSGISTQLEMIASLETEANRVAVKVENGKKKYTLYFTEKQFSQIEFEVDTLNGFFQSLRLVPSEPVHNAKETEELPVVAYEIIVSNYNTKIKELSRPHTNYLELKDKRYFLKPTYSTYYYENNYDWQ